MLISIKSLLIADVELIIVEELLIEVFRAHHQLLLSPPMHPLVFLLCLFGYSLEEDHKAIAIQGVIHPSNGIFSILLVKITEAPTSEDAPVLIANPIKVLNSNCVLLNVI